MSAWTWHPPASRALKLPTLDDFNRSLEGLRSIREAEQIGSVPASRPRARPSGPLSPWPMGGCCSDRWTERVFTEYRKNIRKLKLKGSDALLVDVYDLWERTLTSRLPADSDAAIKALGEILGKNENCDATPRPRMFWRNFIWCAVRADAKLGRRLGLKQFSGYQPRKTAYIEQILKNRLKVKASAAALDDAAEKLRNDKKFWKQADYSELQSHLSQGCSGADCHLPHGPSVCWL